MARRAYARKGELAWGVIDRGAPCCREQDVGRHIFESYLRKVRVGGKSERKNTYCVGD